MGPSSAGSGFGDLIWSCLRLAAWASWLKDIVRSLSCGMKIRADARLGFGVAAFWSARRDGADLGYLGRGWSRKRRCGVVVEW